MILIQELYSTKLTNMCEETKEVWQLEAYREPGLRGLWKNDVRETKRP